jgi:hypothetical protein
MAHAGITRMRFLLLLIALLLTGASAQSQQSRPVVVLVHGRGHLDDDSLAIRRQWKRDLDSALAAVEMPALRDEDVRLAWYADVLDPAADLGCAISPAASDSAGFETFARDFLGSLASALPRNESREARMLLGDMLYAVDASRRCGAERRVAGAIDSALAHRRPVIVVAYSLGAIVAYGNLVRREPRSQELHFITLGSPLGNPEIRTLLGGTPEPLRLPDGVRTWENVYDPDDAFAAPLAGSTRGVRDRATVTGARGDPHYVRRYFRDAATGAALGRALCAATAGVPTPACTRLRAASADGKSTQ